MFWTNSTKQSLFLQSYLEYRTLVDKNDLEPSYVKGGIGPGAHLMLWALPSRKSAFRGDSSKVAVSQFSSVQSLSRVQLFATPWIAARQASLSSTNSRSSLRLKSIESVMPSSHLILCRPLLLLPPIPPSIRVFSNESTLRMRWPKYWTSALASFLPKKSQGWSPSEWTGWISLQPLCKSPKLAVRFLPLAPPGKP